MIITVKYLDREIGQLSEEKGRIFFAYTPNWVREGVELSPIHLPRRLGVHEHINPSFLNLPGLFLDSLPDTWGLRVIRQHFKEQSISDDQLTPLHLLAYLNDRGMGALTYHLKNEKKNDFLNEKISLATLAAESQQLLDGSPLPLSHGFDRISSAAGGARPKILAAVCKNDLLPGAGLVPEGYEAWIIKLAVQTSRDPDAPDPSEHSRMEYAYSLMARAAGITMPPTRLFHDIDKKVHFGVKRFDRQGSGEKLKRIHIHSFAGINHQFEQADYGTLFKITSEICGDYQQLVDLLKRTAFNIAACNCDDHAKNFGFMMNEKGIWSLSPAYDLTFCPVASAPFFHAMSLDNQLAPTHKDLQRLALKHSIEPKHFHTLMEEVREAVRLWPAFAKEAGLTGQYAEKVKETILEFGLPALEP